MSRKILSRREFLRMSALAAGATLLASCGGGTAPAAEAPAQEAAPEEAQAETTQQEEPKAEAPAAAKSEIRFASFDWFAMVPGIKWDQYNQEQAFPKYKETNPEVDILWEPHGDGWAEKVLTQMAANTAPDIMCTWPPIINTWAEKKQLLDLQPLVDRDIPKADELFIKSSWAQMWDPITQ